MANIIIININTIVVFAIVVNTVTSINIWLGSVVLEEMLLWYGCLVMTIVYRSTIWMM